MKATARLAQEAARDQSPVEIYLRAWFANQPPDVYITNDVLHTAISTVKAGRLQGIGAKTLRELGFREFDQRVKNPAAPAAPGERLAGWVRSSHDRTIEWRRLLPMTSGNAVYFPLATDPPHPEAGQVILMPPIPNSRPA